MFNYLAPGGRVLTVEKADLPRVPGCRRLVCISDTHLAQERIALPDGDVLIHAGDVLLESSNLPRAEARAQFAAFSKWLAEKSGHKDVVLVLGNHDARLMDEGAAAIREMLPPRVTYLENETAVVQGLTFFGSPHSVGHSRNYAWQKQTPKGLWQALPREGVDVLVTHGPAFAKGGGRWVVEDELTPALEQSGARLHVFGHLHWCYGLARYRAKATPRVVPTVCCAIMDGQYRPVNKPVVVDLPAAAAAGTAALPPPPARRRVLVAAGGGPPRELRHAHGVACPQLCGVFEVVRCELPPDAAGVAAAVRAVAGGGGAGGFFAALVFADAPLARAVAQALPGAVLAVVLEPRAPSVPAQLATGPQGADDAVSFLLLADAMRGEQPPRDRTLYLSSRETVVAYPGLTGLKP